MRDPVAIFISELREYIPDSLERFSQGSCFGLYRMIRAFRPDAIAMYSMIEGHVYTLVDGRFYDIRGRRSPPKDVLKINDCKPRLVLDAMRWRFGKHIDD